MEPVAIVLIIGLFVVDIFTMMFAVIIVKERESYYKGIIDRYEKYCNRR